MLQLPDSPTQPTDGKAETEARRRNAQLAALHELALDLTSSVGLHEVLQRVAERTQMLSASAHAHLFLYDPERNELRLAASHWSSDQRVVPLQPRNTGITYSVASTGAPEFIEDTAAHPAYAQSPPDLRPGALACLPLVKADRVLGTLNLGYWEPHLFDAETRAFLDLMARHAAIAIENARLYQLALEKTRMEHELQLARELQASLIPRETPRLPGWDFAALWQPAQIVSGDFYDFFPINLGPLQGMMIADVSGKGLPAALFMAMARSTIRASLTTTCCCADCIAHANRVLCADTANGMFVTLCYAQLDPFTGELIYVNAGHNPPLLYRQAEDQFAELTRTGSALGLDERYLFDQRTVRLDPGDWIVFYTDGVTEAINSREQEFGKERVRQVVFDKRRAPAPELVKALNCALRDFSGAAPQFDDITLVVMKRL